MRKISAIVMALIISVMFSVTSFANYFDVMIDDSAMLFTEEETEVIDSSAYEFASANSYSVAVVTTDNALGKSSMDYADDYYDSLIFNSGWSEDGILFLIDMDNREIYVSCAGACIDEYSDYELNSIVDKGYELITYGEYMKCIVSMIDEASALASDEYYSDEYIETGDGIITDGGYYEDDYYYEYNEPQSEEFNFLHVFFYVAIGLAAGGITVLVIKNQYKNTGKGDEFNAQDISLELTASTDNIISRNVITTKIPKNNNNHRSGGGGGVSVHRSSGGVRHSGAGRKF